MAPAEIRSIYSKNPISKSKERIADNLRKRYDLNLKNKILYILSGRHRAEIEELKTNKSQLMDALRENEAKLSQQENQILNLETKISKQEVQIEEQSHIIDQNNQDILSLKKQIKALIQDIGDLEEEKKERWEQKERRKDNFIQKTFLKYYFTQTEKRIPSNYNGISIYFDMKKGVYTEMLANARIIWTSSNRSFRLPNINKVEIENIQNESYDILHFLEYASPYKTKSFIFAADKSNPEIDFYLSGLEKALPAASNEVSICNWKLSNLAFERIVKASANSKCIIVSSSMTDSTFSFNFSGHQYSTEYFEFPYYRDKSDSNHSNMEQIIIAISNSSMKKSIKTLKIINCGETMSNVQYQLNRYQLKNVKLEGNYDEEYDDSDSYDYYD